MLDKPLKNPMGMRRRQVGLEAIVYRTGKDVRGWPASIQPERGISQRGQSLIDHLVAEFRHEKLQQGGQERHPSIADRERPVLVVQSDAAILQSNA